MEPNSKKKSATLLGTIGTLLLALVVYFLQGGKDQSAVSSSPQTSPPKPAPVVETVTGEKPQLSLEPETSKPSASPKVAEMPKPEAPPPAVKKPEAPAKTSAAAEVRTTQHKTRWHSGNLKRHWEKHAAEFPEYHSAEEYGKATVAFVTNPPEGTLRKTTAEGDQMFYHPPSNRFAVVTSDGFLKTCFKPDQGIRYWNRQ